MTSEIQELNGSLTHEMGETDMERAEGKNLQAITTQAEARIVRAEATYAQSAHVQPRCVENPQEEALTAQAPECVKPEGGETVTRQLLREHRLEIYVNEQLVARLVCTAEDLENLVIGRLVTEGIICDAEEIEQFYLCESGNRARVFLKGNVKFEPKEAEEPTCCTDNHVYLKREEDAAAQAEEIAAQREEIATQREEPAAQTEEPAALPGQGNRATNEERLCGALHADRIFKIVKAFSDDSALHRSTGGTHSCLLAVEERIVYWTEDIGRHNALDKVIGYAFREKLDLAKCIVFTTGRVPTDMVRKAVTAGIPVLVSKAVPTTDAVEMAKKNGLTLICRAWPDSFEVYG